MQWYFYIYKCNGRELKLKIRKQLNVIRKIGRTKKNQMLSEYKFITGRIRKCNAIYISYMYIKKRNIAM